MFRYRSCAASGLVGMVLALTTCVAAGCGDDGEKFGAGIIGTYQTTAHTQNTDDCAQEGESILEVMGPEFFKLSAESFFGQQFIGFHECDTLAACEEADGVTLGGWMFTEKEGDAWVGEPLATSSPGTVDGESQGVLCTVSLAKVRATADGAQVRLERREYFGAFNVQTDDDCEPDLAREKFAELRCGELTVLRGTSEF